MLKTLSETFFSLVLPLGCELCGTPLPARDAQGICASCQNHVSLIMPPYCAGCGRTVLEEGDRCGHCVGEYFHFDHAFGCVYYDEKMKKLLHAFKFERRKFLLPFFTGILESFVRENLSNRGWDVAIPVPMDSAHERERGFNQARLFSAVLAKKFGKNHTPESLRCRKAISAQSSLKKSERKQNVEGRFFVRRAENFAFSRVLLIDDILTTGQTASACAQALKEAGAASVSVLAFARGI